MKDKKQQDGFRTPSEYFENFEDRLFHKIEEETLPKETGFSVPDGYFEAFDDKLFDRIGSSKAQGKVISLVRNRKVWFATSIAASLAILFMLLRNDNGLQTEINKIQISSIETYIEEGNLELDSYDISALLNDEELSNLSLKDDLFTEESLQDYLLENIDDTTLLIE